VSEWVEWHKGYRPGSPLAKRLALVQGLIRTALDSCAPGPIRVISMCAGDGRDLLGVLEDHPRRGDVSARLVELDPDLAASGREHAKAISPYLEFITGDASTTSAYATAVPADIVLVCGVFGNVADEDIEYTVDQLPTLCAPGAMVIWTRGTFKPDITPVVRAWFEASGFAELTFVAIPDTSAGVGAARLVVPPRAFEPDLHLFTFLSRANRPSRRFGMR
jgi:hypothetical protein